MDRLILTPHEVHPHAHDNLINKIICGDAIEVMHQMPKNFVHLIITSPPYNVGIPYDNHDDLLPYKTYLEFLESA